MKVKTDVLKDLVSKAIQGATNNKLIPITQLMGIRNDGGTLNITTTDSSSYLSVCADIKEKDKLNVTVYAEQFAKLISKITSEFVELNVNDNALTVKGNGEYTLELPMDESGSIIVYPDPYSDALANKEKPIENAVIKATDIKSVVDSLKSSLYTASDDRPALTNYYVGVNVVSTDRRNIASYTHKLVKNEMLISAHTMELLTLMDGDIHCMCHKGYTLFSNIDDTILIYSVSNADVEEYPIGIVDKILENTFKSVCTINKNELISILDRIALFVGKYDDSAIRLYFEKNGIRVANKARKSYETIDYITSKDHKDYDCTVNVETLIAQIKSLPTDSIEIHYNNDNTLKFVSGDLVKIVALMIE